VRPGKAEISWGFQMKNFGFRPFWIGVSIGAACVMLVCFAAL
jgi:hypothetical protein